MYRRNLPKTIFTNLEIAGHKSQTSLYQASSLSGYFFAMPLCFLKNRFSQEHVWLVSARRVSFKGAVVPIPILIRLRLNALLYSLRRTEMTASSFANSPSNNTIWASKGTGKHYVRFLAELSSSIDVRYVVPITNILYAR